MKTIVLCMLGLLVIPAVSLHAGDDPYHFEVYVQDFQDDDVEVYGAFSAAENEFGGIELVFYKDFYSYAIRGIESVRDLMTSPLSTGVMRDEESVIQIVRIFLKPAAIGGGKVRLTGNMTIMVNAAEKGEPLYRLVQKPLQLTMAADERRLLPVDPGSPGKRVELALVLRVKEDADVSAGTTHIGFKAYYSLFNVDDNSFEVEDAPCRLTFAPGEIDENVICRHSRMYNLDNGDSLLYVVEYDIDAAKQLTDETIDFTVAVRRFFFENPISYFSSESDGGTGTDGYGVGHRTVDCVISINGKERRVRAEIDSGRVTHFQLDNIEFLPRDITRNWADIVAILKRIETTGDYAYRQPVLDNTGDTASAGPFSGLLASPGNYTGDRLTTTTYSKSITITRRENAEIQIPFTKSHRLPFDGYEIIRLELVNRRESGGD